MRIDSKLTFNEWLTFLKVKRIALNTIKPIIKYHKAKEELKKQPNFQFLLEVEHQN